jgi:hypothetical protein
MILLSPCIADNPHPRRAVEIFRARRIPRGNPRAFGTSAIRRVNDARERSPVFGGANCAIPLFPL